MAIKNSLTVKEQTLILEKLQTRFESNMHRHPEFHWLEVQKKLESNPDKLRPLILMEATEGEPDVVGKDSITSQYVFFDCSKESPRGRRSICFDRQAQLERKKYPPRNNAEEMAAELGIEMLDESQYRYLQNMEKVDTKTSSWIKTPQKIRKLGGALFADFRYETVFIYHNGADSYYSTRGFRASVKV